MDDQVIDHHGIKAALLICFYVQCLQLLSDKYKIDLNKFN